ncbi:MULTISPECIES: hypothetical protein [unclassified Microcoleus]|uniref:hypothetical protein n=1 Tax=unclassified Microcoleus TaxID=2642155 RepID=UPI002FD4F915
MKAMQPKKSQTIPNEPNQALWKEIGDEVAAQIGGGGRVKGWAKCQVPGKCKVGIDITIVRF